MREILVVFGRLLALLLPMMPLSAQNREQKTDVTMEKSNDMKSDRKILVAFFSHTGENYGVGDISKGNTHIVAEMIAGETGGRLFEIAPEQEYPRAYNACVEVAKKEKESAARPAVKEDIAVEEYDVIFLGYPNWWGDLPMPVYIFLEKHDWAGKTVIPFCTHEGSGLSATERYVGAACREATVAKGLAVRGVTAQSSQDQARKAVGKWLEKLEY